MTTENNNYARPVMYSRRSEILFFNDANPPAFRHPGEWCVWRAYPGMPPAVHLVGEDSVAYVARNPKAAR